MGVEVVFDVVDEGFELDSVIDVEDVVFVPETGPGIVVELDVDVGFIDETGVVVVADETGVVVVADETGVVILALVAKAAPGVRYQFVSGSWRHSPAVTPFQPLAWINP